MSAELGAATGFTPAIAPAPAIQVVVAYDFSPVAEEALRRAIEMACLAPEHVLHVITAINPKSGLALAPTTQVTPAYTARARYMVTVRVADMLMGRAHAAQVKYVVHVPVGQPATEILALAQALGAALVFVGSHNRTSAEKAALGSVSDRVLREAHCTVVVTRQRAPRTAG